jgi:FKBP-type peptidyl-prolyl cis-trans isomerase FkpA
VIKRAILLIVLLSAAGCGGSSTSTSSVPPTSVGVFTTTDIVVGTGATAASGSRVTTLYAGWLYDTGKPNGKGAQFDPGPGPLNFVIGSGTLVRGFEQGVIGMRVGGQRRVIIPPELAYGSSSPNPATIPPNATLVFEISLTAVQ